ILSGAGVTVLDRDRRYKPQGLHIRPYFASFRPNWGRWRRVELNCKKYIPGICKPRDGRPGALVWCLLTSRRLAKRPGRRRSWGGCHFGDVLRVGDLPGLVHDEHSPRQQLQRKPALDQDAPVLPERLVVRVGNGLHRADAFGGAEPPLRERQVE